MNLYRKESAEIVPNQSSIAIWKARTKEYPTELHDPLSLTLDKHGMIRNCSKSFGRLFDYQHHDLLSQHVSMLFPQLSGIDLLQDGRINPFLDFLCHCDHIFYATSRQGGRLRSYLNFVHLERDGRNILRLIVCPSGLQKLKHRIVYKQTDSVS